MQYIWYKEKHSKWVLVMVRHEVGETMLHRLSDAIAPLPADAIFHRLDLLPPQEAKVCRHFNQMATLGNFIIQWYSQNFLLKNQ